MNKKTWCVTLAAAAACATSPTMDPVLEESIGYYTGTIGVVDDERAHALLLQAADDDDPLSVMWIARVHSTGRMGFPEDVEHARAVASGVIDEIERLAGEGEPEAVFLMGTAYAEGLGKPVEPATAAQWYRRAAALGNILAIHNMGNIHRDGVGVEQSDSLAIHWWIQAAREGDAIPALRLGQFYESGRGAPADTSEAIRWYDVAAVRGNQDAQMALDRLRASPN